MFTVKLDFSVYGKFAEEMGKARDQLPFVFSSLLNDAAFNARRVWVESTWPRHVDVRNSAFLNAALQINKATKSHLVVELRDRLGRDYLQRLAKGGIKRPIKGRSLGVPLKSWVTRSARGRPPSQKIQAIIARTPKRALRITPKGLFVGQGGRLHLRYTWRSQVIQPKRVPFYEDWEFVVRNTLRTGFGARVAKAVATRRVTPGS